MSPQFEDGVCKVCSHAEIDHLPTGVCIADLLNGGGQCRCGMNPVVAKNEISEAGEKKEIK